MIRNWRLYVCMSFLILVAASIMSRLFYLQVFNHKFYQAQALGQQTGFSEVFGKRGEIFLTNSRENKGSEALGNSKSVAINKDKWLLSVVSKNIQDKESVSQILSPIIEETPEIILAKLKKSDSYMVIKKDLSEKELNALKKLKITGVNLENVTIRYYPELSMASQLIGFLGGKGIGQYGLEGYYDNILKGKSGIREEKKGLSIINSKKEEDLDGANLYLTIDYNIQFQAEFLLKEEKQKSNIDSGQIVVIKPDSGRILALANFPSFDLNHYSKEKDLSIFQNAIIQKLFEPGSVFKPFTMAMALNEGAVTPQSTFADTGLLKFGSDTIRNFNREIYGQVNMSEILEKSINTGAAYLSQSLSRGSFLNYLDKFGFSYKTGIDLQGEIYSKNEILRKASDFGFATASFGQGIEMTPIQLVAAFSMFANGGKIVKPFVVDKITQGEKEIKTKFHLSDNVILPETAQEVNKMLINVVEKGFGSGAKIPGYYLAGKTGTAEVPYENKKGYYADKTIQSFIGYGPALNPEFLILVKLDNPKVPKSALSAVPIFKKLAQYIINYWQIPPDYTK